MIACGHYAEALRLWGEPAKPLVLLHLYIAVEALTRVLYRRGLANAGSSEDDFMRSLGVDPTEKDAKYRALAQTRVALIFQSDNATYQAIRKASDGIEHGYAGFEEIWAVPFEICVKTADYLRSAILSAIDLPPEDLATLEEPRYKQVCIKRPPPSIRGTFGIRPPTGLEIRPFIEPGDYRALSYEPELEAVVEDPSLGTYDLNYRNSVT
jgi:hypothetical protein